MRRYDYVIPDNSSQVADDDSFLCLKAFNSSMYPHDSNEMKTMFRGDIYQLPANSGS